MNGYNKRVTAPVFRILFCIVLVLMYPAIAAGQSSDDGGVLDEARQKYDSRFGQSTEEEATAGAEFGSSTSSGSWDGVNVDVGIEVIVDIGGESDEYRSSVSTSADILANTESDDSDSSGDSGSDKKDLPYHALSAQIAPGLPDDGDGTAAGLVLGATVSSVGAVKGLQASMIGSIAGEVQGAQMATIFNISHGDTAFFQGAGIFNISGDLKGVQFSGIFNEAKNVSGVQYAGIFNIAEDVEGLQVAGILNVAQDVKGVQIGIVNIADTMEGIAIGLVNVSRNTISERVLWWDDTDFMYGGFQFGAGGIYGLAYMGSERDDIGIGYESLTWGTHLGFRAGEEHLYFQTDAGIKSGLEVTEFFDPKLYRRELSVANNIFPSLRVTAGMRFWGPFAIYGGIGADVSSESLWEMPERYESQWRFDLPGNDLTMHLRWFFGISF